MASTGEAARVHLTCGAAAVTALALSIQFGAVGVTYPDREVAQAAGRLLLGGHLDVYAVMPRAQMGPLALLVAALLPTWLFVVALCGTLYGILFTAFRTWSVTPGLVVTGAAGLVGAVWHRFALTGHADDVLVLLGGVLICYADRRDSRWLATVGFVLAIAGKPTAVLLLPLVLLVSRRAAVWAVVGTAVVWLPFALADLTGFLRAGRGVVGVMPYSLPGILGAEVYGAYPWWVRPTQLVVGLVVCWVVGRRVGFASAIAVALALRTMLEPGTFPLYWQSIIVAGFLVDLASTRWRRVPWVTLLGLAGWMVTLTYALTPALGSARLCLLAAVCVAAVVAREVPRGARASRPREVEEVAECVS